MHKIIVDIETTGLPIRDNGKSANPSILKCYDSSRIVELGYYIIDINNNIIKEREFLVKPDNFIISDEVVKIHGITQERALKEGQPIKIVLNKLEEDLIYYNVNKFISHNVDFDKNIILSECYRLNNESIIDKLLPMSNYCTMKDNKIFNNKWPKLSVLYEELFNKQIIVEHRALADVKLCYECYCKLTKEDCKLTKEDCKLTKEDCELNNKDYMILRDNKRIKKDISIY